MMLKPPTKLMIEVLMDCHERELLGLEPYEASSLRSASGLIQRGLITVKPYINIKGKMVIGIYLTNAAKNYLKNI